MKNTRKILLMAIGILGIVPTIAWAYPNLDIVSLWKKGTGNAIHPLNTADELGSSAIRISKGWFTDFDVTNISASSVTISGAVTGNLLPDGNNTRDIGSPTLSWKDIYASGTLYIPTVSPTNITWTNATGTNTTSTNLAVTNVAQMGTASATTMIAGWGAVGTPGFAFSGDTNTGIYNSAADTMILARGGSNGIQVGPSLNYSYNHFMPADATTDLGSSASAWRNIYANTSVSSTLFVANPGTVGAPSYTFSDDTDTGIYSAGANYMGFVSGGVLKQTIQSTQSAFGGNVVPLANNSYDLGLSAFGWKNIYASGTLSIAGGTKAAPAINFTGSQSSGIYSPAAQDIRIEKAGTTDLAIFNANGVSFNDHTFAGSNNAYDLGKTTASWKDIYASGTLYINGDIIPSQNSISILGSTNNRFADIKTSKITFANAIALNNYAVSYASTTVGLTGGSSADGDIGYIGREFIFTGSTLGTTGNTLSLIESPTSTLKVTDGTSGWGNISAGGGAANAAVCWKSDARTLGYCSTVVAADGTCTCN